MPNRDTTVGYKTNHEWQHHKAISTVGLLRKTSVRILVWWLAVVVCKGNCCLLCIEPGHAAATATVDIMDRASMEPIVQKSNSQVHSVLSDNTMPQVSMMY